MKLRWSRHAMEWMQASPEALRCARKETAKGKTKTTLLYRRKRLWGSCSSFHRCWTNLFEGNNPFALEHRIKLVGCEILDYLRRPRRPVNFNAIQLGRRAQAKVNPQIILRKIAAPTVNLLRLRHSPGHNLQTSANRQAIALGARQFEADPVSPWNPGILQKRWKA